MTHANIALHALAATGTPCSRFEHEEEQQLQVRRLTIAARDIASRSSTVVGSTAVSSTPNAPAPAGVQKRREWWGGVGGGWFEACTNTVQLRCTNAQQRLMIAQTQLSQPAKPGTERTLRACMHGVQAPHPALRRAPAAVPAVLITASRTSSSSITSAERTEANEA